MALPSAQESTCPICGIPLTFSAFHAHMRTEHPAYVAAEHKREADEKLALGKLFIPGLLIWVVIVGLVLVEFPGNVEYFMGLMFVVVALIALSVLYAHESTRVDAAAIDAIGRKCRICGVELDAVQMEQHLRTVHPQEVAYLREGWAYAFGIVVAIGALLLFLWIELVPYLDSASYRSFGRIAGMGGLLAWTGAMIVWRRFVDTRHIARVRRAWEHMHGATLPPEWTGA